MKVEAGDEVRRESVGCLQDPRSDRAERDRIKRAFGPRVRESRAYYCVRSAAVAAYVGVWRRDGEVWLCVWIW